MSLITVVVSKKQRAVIEHMVSSGRAVTEAHAIRMAIDLLAREDALARIRRGQQEIREGTTLRGDLDALAKEID